MLRHAEATPTIPIGLSMATGRAAGPSYLCIAKRAAML
jgi:hypothetical protein